MTRNDAAWNERAKQRALDTYAQVAPAAKNAGLTARQGYNVVVAWTTPRVQGARVWAAPRVEQAGFAVRDRIAPAVSAALIEASHRLDDSRSKRSRWPWMLAGMGLLAAAGSAVAAIVLKRSPEIETFGAEDQMTADSAMPASGETARGQANGGADEETSAANGRMRTP